MLDMDLYITNSVAFTEVSGKASVLGCSSGPRNTLPTSKKFSQMVTSIV